MLRLPALLLQAKTHQWTREARLASPGALRPPRPRWRCSEPLSHRGRAQQTRCTGSSISSPPASQTASALPQEHQRRCLDATCSRGVPQSGAGEAKPPRGALPAPVSSQRARLSASVTPQEHASLPPPRDSDSLAASSFPPPGFGRRARCFSWEDSLQHPSACSPASWQGSSGEGNPLPTRGAPGNPGGGEQRAKEALSSPLRMGKRERAGRRSKMYLP